MFGWWENKEKENLIKKKNSHPDISNGIFPPKLPIKISHWNFHWQKNNLQNNLTHRQTNLKKKKKNSIPNMQK